MLGKIIGGGLPVAAYGGRREIMDMIAPLGPVYQAGTLSGNPLAMRAGLATLPKLEAPGFLQLAQRESRASCRRLARGAATSGRSGPSECSRFAANRIFHRRSSLRLRATPRNRTPRVSPPFSARCSHAAFSFRPRNSRRSSFPPLTPIRTSTARFQPSNQAWLRFRSPSSRSVRRGIRRGGMPGAHTCLPIHSLSR